MGAANPLEWILPPVAITHELAGAAAGVTGANPATVSSPGSPNAQRQAAAEDLTNRPRPTLGTPIVAPTGQTPREEEASRRRASEARQRLGNYSTRASDQLTMTGSLG